MSSEWNAGYVVDAAYTFGYYSQLSALHARWNLLLSGRAGLEQPAAACELGFGNGISINIHAAANPSTMHWGTDFNPAQASFAQALAESSQNGARLFDQNFAEFSARSDLPEFDFVGLHGVWSWVGPRAQQEIVDFLRRHVRPGGVVYLSYNSLPGWASIMPIRELLVRHASSMGRLGEGTLGKVAGAWDFVSALMALNPNYLANNAMVQSLMNSLRGRDPRYLAHEFFNADWTPFYFADVAHALTEAKLVFATPADYLDHLSPLHLSAEADTFLRGISDPILRETSRDYFINAQFRSDYWVKGAAILSATERDERIRAFRFVLRMPRQRVELKARGARGEVALLESAHVPVLDALADDGGRPKSVAQIERALAGGAARLTLPNIIQVLTALAGLGCIAPAHATDEEIERAKPSCSRFNQAVLEQTMHSGQVAWLAAPATGSGYSLGRIHQLLWLSGAGTVGLEESAAAVWSILQSQGQTVTRKGIPVVTPEDNLRELTDAAREFIAEQLPVLRVLGIA